MIRILLKKQLAEIFRSYFYDDKKNKARSKAAVAAYIVLFAVIMLGVLGGVFTYLSLSICRPMYEAGMGWLYFALMGLLAIFLGTFGSVFNTYSGLYLAKDNDLLLSLPIPVKIIMSSRLLGVYIMGLMYSAVIILPAIVVYIISTPANAAVIAGCILLVVLISVFVLTLSCALGWVVAKISLKLKNKSFITVVISLVFISAYYFFYFKAQTVISDLVTNAGVYGMKIKGSAYPVYLFGMTGTGDWMAMLIVSAVVLLLFALMWLLISRSFLKIATSSGRAERKIYVERSVKQRSINSALLSREFARFVSSPNYMLNCGLGIIILPVSGIIFLLKGGDIFPVLDGIFADRPGSTAALLCTAICLLTSMNDMVVPSVSLEGKNLWLIQSLPVHAWQALRAKLSVQLLLSGVSALIGIVCIAFAYHFSGIQLLAVIAATMSFVSLMTLLGLFLGLKMPNLTWTSEVTPIKQSAGVLLEMLAGFVYAAILFVLYYAAGYKLGFSAYMCCAAAVNLVLSALLHIWLKTRGAAVFSAL